jgi:serine/threonine protein kinase
MRFAHCRAQGDVMGEVYLAHTFTLRRKVALKTLRAELNATQELLQRFERKESRFIVTEFVDGESLSQHIRREPLRPHEIFGIGIQIASAPAAIVS